MYDLSILTIYIHIPNIKESIKRVCMKARDSRVYMYICLLYTSDAADDLLCVDLGGRRIIKKKMIFMFILSFNDYFHENTNYMTFEHSPFTLFIHDFVS